MYMRIFESPSIRPESRFSPFVPSLSKHSAQRVAALLGARALRHAQGERAGWFKSTGFGASTIVTSLLLAGCGERRTDHATLAKVEAAQRAAQEDRGEIVCAQGGSADFARACTVDRAASEAGLILTVRHPDGAFHRLLVTKDGRGVVAADGAERAVVSVIGDGQIEVALGGDRYRLPATVKGGSPATP